MSFDTFSSLTIQEFERVYRKWAEKEDELKQESWEQTRMLSFYMLQTKKLKDGVSMTTFMPLPWDGKAKTEKKKLRDPERFAKLKEKYGETI